MSIPSRVPSAASSDTFTNDSPHTMIVRSPRRSTKWCSSNGGTTPNRPKRKPSVGHVEQREPDQPERDAWALGCERGHEDGQGGGAVLVPADRGQVRGLVVPVHRARVHHGHVERERARR